jgi:hypothetical protein
MGCCSSLPHRNGEGRLVAQDIIVKQTSANRSQQQQTIFESLKCMKCCENMNPNQLKQAAGVFVLGTATEGQVIFREGDVADCFYIIGR